MHGTGTRIYVPPKPPPIPAQHRADHGRTYCGVRRLDPIKRQRLAHTVAPLAALLLIVAVVFGGGRLLDGLM